MPARLPGSHHLICMCLSLRLQSQEAQLSSTLRMRGASREPTGVVTPWDLTVAFFSRSRSCPEEWRHKGPAPSRPDPRLFQRVRSKVFSSLGWQVAIRTYNIIRPAVRSGITPLLYSRPVPHLSAFNIHHSRLLKAIDMTAHASHTTRSGGPSGDPSGGINARCDVDLVTSTLATLRSLLADFPRS